MAEEPRKFRVDLDHSRGPRVFRDQHNLWRDDIGRIYRLVERHIQALEREQRPKQEDNRYWELHPDKLPYLSIAIFGPSGSGKSSLLRTLADDIGRRQGGILPEDLRSDVFSLPVIDPTTWEESDQFLYAFLAAALEAERKKSQEGKEHGYPQGLSPVQLAFQDVNEYLRVVDDPGTTDEHDPLGLSLQKLERHTSGLRLKKALGEFIKALAKEFKSGVVLLPVDDLDMAPHHLVKSLQAYQSFLMHPQLVPVFTFTDRMPEELIEVYYDQRLGNGERQRRIEVPTEKLTVSQKLAVQFLARCFPVRNRIRLGPAPARVQRAIFVFRSERGSTASEEQGSKASKEQQQVLELLISSSFLLFGYPDEDDAHKVRAALRPSTLRRQFQVVDAMADCRLPELRIPQLATMAKGSITPEDLKALVSDAPEIQKDDWQHWRDHGYRDCRLGQLWRKKEDGDLLGSDRRFYYRALAKRLYHLRIGATWATIFNGATWSLLNVHRDTLRELGLFLEDLYSWSPKELRSVVLGKILEQDRTVRRSVVDRWFNRTDFRRSQVLSLLAANVFRPWMAGEEPYGDEELPIREQLLLELEDDESPVPPLDRQWDKDKSKQQEEAQIRKRLTFRSTQGLLWFLDVTLGFYLPQVMARNWAETMVPGEPVKERMSGNGWDLGHAPISAMRIADSKQEIFSFGMLFLGPRGYRHALEAFKLSDSESDNEKVKAWRGNASPRGRLLLRIWSCCGYSRSRYWAAFSLWRGLGFIGQLAELGLKERRLFESIATEQNEHQNDRNDLLRKFRRLIRSHCLASLVPGTLLDRDSNDLRLLQGFPPWEPDELRGAIRELAEELVDWLARCWADRIFPLPAGDVWISWRDCFIRRIHGEYILGALWPRLNATYLEERPRRHDCQILARRRSYREERVEAANRHYPDPDPPGSEPPYLEHEERFRWTAAVAAGAWSDRLLEYWRGCPPILRLLLTCPVFLKSRERFGLSSDPEGNPDKLLEELKQKSGKWLQRLKLRDVMCKELAELWTEKGKLVDGKLEIPGLVPDEFCIERVRVEFFASRPVQRHSISIERTKIAEIEEIEGEGEMELKEKPSFTVKSAAIEYPQRPKKKPTGSPEKPKNAGSSE